jgi:hypothetical protein
VQIVYPVRERVKVSFRDVSRCIQTHQDPVGCPKPILIPAIAVVVAAIRSLEVNVGPNVGNLYDYD